MHVKLFIFDINNYYPYTDLFNATLKHNLYTSHITNHGRIHLLILSTHAHQHETNLPVYVITITVNIIHIFDCHAKAVF